MPNSASRAKTRQQGQADAHAEARDAAIQTVNEAIAEASHYLRGVSIHSPAFVTINAMMNNIRDLLDQLNNMGEDGDPTLVLGMVSSMSAMISQGNLDEQPSNPAAAPTTPNAAASLGGLFNLSPDSVSVMDINELNSIALDGGDFPHNY